jgi:hypothetical protein
MVIAATMAGTQVRTVADSRAWAECARQFAEHLRPRR